MKKRILSVVLVVAAFLSATLFQNTFAWFTVDSYLTQSFIVGDVNYELTYTPDEGSTFKWEEKTTAEEVTKEQSEADTPVIENDEQSETSQEDESVEQPETTSTTRKEGKRVLPGDEILLGTLKLVNKSTIPTEIRFKLVDTVRPNATDGFVIEFTDSNLWKSENGYYIYGTTVNGELVSDIPAATDSNGSEISFIKNIKYNGEAIERDQYSGKDSTVTLIFQAKQGEFATWEDIGEFKI